MQKLSPVDAEIGGRLRQLRLAAKVSQEQLGSSLGITFQQVQKYERGANRISASRLWQICRLFSVSPSYFFEGLDEESSGGADFAARDKPSQGLDAIADERVRTAVRNLIQALG